MLRDIKATYGAKRRCRQISLRSTLVCFADIVLFFSLFCFIKLKVCGNSELSKCIDTMFPKEFAHYMTLGHILVILAIFQVFHYSYICNDDL